MSDNVPGAVHCIKWTDYKKKLHCPIYDTKNCKTPDNPPSCPLLDNMPRVPCVRYRCFPAKNESAPSPAVDQGFTLPEPPTHIMTSTESAVNSGSESMATNSTGQPLWVFLVGGLGGLVVLIFLAWLIYKFVRGGRRYRAFDVDRQVEPFSLDEVENGVETVTMDEFLNQAQGGNGNAQGQVNPNMANPQANVVRRSSRVNKGRPPNRLTF